MEKYAYLKKKSLDEYDLNEIRRLEQISLDYDHHALKLELDYKAAVAKNQSQSDIRIDYTDFFCRNKDRLVGYLGIVQFGIQPAEISGMVDPAFREKGIFTELLRQATQELLSHNHKNFLILCDAQSSFNHILSERYFTIINHTEYEMFIDNSLPQPNPVDHDLTLVSATNNDVEEIIRQNKGFGMGSQDDPIDFNPEEEAKNGIDIMLIKHKDSVIGKIHLASNGGIYGFYIKPESRGKGYGKAALQLALAYYFSKGKNRVFLQVDSTNDIAYHLYKSSGFVTESAMNYHFFDLENLSKRVEFEKTQKLHI